MKYLSTVRRIHIERGSTLFVVLEISMALKGLWRTYVQLHGTDSPCAASKGAANKCSDDSYSASAERNAFRASWSYRFGMRFGGSNSLVRIPKYNFWCL